MGQSVFSFSTSGTLPWGLPAGKIAVALGAEDRLEQQRNQRDPLQLGASGVFESGNFSQFAGQFNVQEGFLELDVPVLKNQFVDDLNFNAAGRITSYSTSGMVETWKLGATSQVNEDIKLRTTLSSDIRAPGIGELFSPILVSTQTQSYPPGGPSFQVRRAPGGQPAAAAGTGHHGVGRHRADAALDRKPVHVLRLVFDHPAWRHFLAVVRSDLQPVRRSEESELLPVRLLRPGPAGQWAGDIGN